MAKDKFDTEKYKYLSNCQICLIDYVHTDDVTVLKCNDKHYFHTKCIEEWIQSGHPDCPFCREKILPEEEEEKKDEEDLIMDAPMEVNEMMDEMMMEM